MSGLKFHFTKVVHETRRSLTNPKEGTCNARDTFGSLMQALHTTSLSDCRVDSLTAIRAVFRIGAQVDMFFIWVLARNPTTKSVPITTVWFLRSQVSVVDKLIAVRAGDQKYQNR